jgi:hypothetical protein
MSLIYSGLIFDLHCLKGGVLMAKDGEGRKYNRIPAHTREQNGKTITVSEHVRSNRSDSKGGTKKK